MMKLFCLLATFALVACGSWNDLAGVETIGVTYADGQLLGSSIFTGEHRIIPLSAPTADAQIREVERVMFARDRIFVMDRRGNKVLAFDGSGRFVASTAPLMGRGHNEYIRVIDAAVDCDSGLVYAFCDAPYCVMVLDFNLRLKRKTDLGFYLSEVAQDSRYVYGLQRSGDGKTGSRIVAIDKRRPESAPRTVLQTEKGVMGVLTTAGKSLTNFGDTVLACLPHDNIVYMLHDGKEVGAFGVDFGARNPVGLIDGLRYDAFLSRNKKSDWIIHNMACSDSLMLFNTNSHYVYVVDLTARSCRTAMTFVNERFPFSTSLMLPAQGVKGSVVYGVRQDDLTGYVRRRQERGKSVAQSLVDASARCDGRGNPVLVVWKLRWSRSN